VSDTSAADPTTGGDIGEVEYEEVELPFEEPVEEPQRQYIEVDDPDNRFTRVRVDGEDVEVPYSELVKGYSREADYTRKTQALAQQRQEAEQALIIQRALQANPRQTVAWLAEQAGLTVAQPQQAPAPEEDDRYADPLEREIAAERQARLALEQRLNQREMDERVGQALNDLRTQHGATDDEVREVVQVAMNGNYPIELLPMIYKSITLDRLQARVQAARAAKVKQEAETTRRTAAKSQASTAVTSRTTGANGLTNSTQLQERPTLRQAIEDAWEQANRS